ncbi:HupE/UreJ family protein [Paenarthrobacter sp. NPDC090522]|uniref:HupE/UreJ family protein n=1 Tax=Paenarthrobacter sp. NPDC090522 TaxID=3364383 RepID=UPI003817B07E
MTKARTAVVRSLAAALLILTGLLALGTTPASAHVLPNSTVELTIAEDHIDARVNIPLDDLSAASGINLGDGSAETVAARATDITAYLLAHFTPTSDTGQAWAVSEGGLTVTDAGSTATTGIYKALETTFTLTPPSGTDERSFNLGYDAVVHQVVTHIVLVSVASDWAGGAVDGAYQLGTIRLDTVTGTVPSLHVDLGDGSTINGFLSMVALGIQHIREGTDHQLFLLTLLIPAPLLALRGRWSGPATPGKAVRRICGVTMAFTLGHSVTLAMGTLGVPVPSAPIEALIALSILVAAVHAIRPVFAGKEQLVAGFFGLIHGLAFSETLHELDLTGTRLGLSLLGFNLGIEIMQVAVVALVLPPLVVMARYRFFQPFRIGTAVLAAVAASGWMAARLGMSNVIASTADGLESASLPVIVALWGGALLILVRRPKSTEAAVRPLPSVSPVGARSALSDYGKVGTTQT